MKYQLFLKCSGLDSDASEDETDRDSDTQSPTGAATHRRDTWKNAPIASKTGLLLSLFRIQVRTIFMFTMQRYRTVGSPRNVRN